VWQTSPSKALLDAFNFVHIDFKTGIPYDGRKLKNMPDKNTERFIHVNKCNCLKFWRDFKIYATGNFQNLTAEKAK